ncbi:MAG: hypothetical protein V4521_10670 [Pseudomonadota bacterium]
MIEAEFVEKLERLETTSNHAERHTLALELSDTGDQRVLSSLVRLVQLPHLQKWRGTLVFCLGSFDCSGIVDLLVTLVENDDGEASWTASGILKEQRLVSQ